MQVEITSRDVLEVSAKTNCFSLLGSRLRWGCLSSTITSRESRDCFLSFPCFSFQAESWITEKLQTASDESYKDPANLESKLQKHLAFEAELTAHEEAIDAVRETGEDLITSGHFAAEEVERRIEALYLHWEELLEASATKGKRLEEARDHQKFNQEVDIADSCISEKVRR